VPCFRLLLRTWSRAFRRRGDAAVVGAFRQGLDPSLKEPFSDLCIDGRLTDGDEDEQGEQGEMTIFCARLRADKYCPALLSICRAVRPFCREPPLGGRFLSTQRKKRSPPIWRANGA